MAEEGPFDYALGNPPYVPIEGLSKEEKARYRSNLQVAKGRFDLYLLFFERVLSLLAPGGRLVFVRPEKWEYVETTRPLRKMVAGGRRGSTSYHVAKINQGAYRPLFSLTFEILALQKPLEWAVTS